MKEKIVVDLKKMTNTLSEMIDLVYQGFMENDTQYLNRALNKENIMNDLEKEITDSVVQLSRTLDEKGQKEFVLLVQVAQNLERMGDELRYLMERLEIKIVEDLLFSDIGVEQYKDTFEKMRKSVNLTIEFLDKNKNELLETILKNGDEVKETVGKYRKEHLVRLTKGLCKPRAANM